MSKAIVLNEKFENTVKVWEKLGLFEIDKNTKKYKLFIFTNFLITENIFNNFMILSHNFSPKLLS